MYFNQNFNSNPYQFPPRQEVIRVNGENGARAFQLAPNSSVLLLDETDPVVWLAMTDGAGYKTVTPYSISPLVREPQKSLEDRIKRLEEMYESHFNANEQRIHEPVATPEAAGTRKPKRNVSTDDAE